MVALAEAHQVVNVHISSLLGVFLTPELNPVWNERLTEQRLLDIGGIRHAYQVYDLPWPVADRELLILCKDTEHPAEGVRSHYKPKGLAAKHLTVSALACAGV